jgi:hypothetical protein
MEKIIVVSTICILSIVSLFSGCVNVPKEVTPGSDETTLPGVTPSISIGIDSDSNKMFVTSTDENVKWNDIVITNDTGYSNCHWTIYDDGGVTNRGTNIMPTSDITAGDYILIWGVTGNVKITMRYVPTNTLLGTWTINV